MVIRNTTLLDQSQVGYILDFVDYKNKNVGQSARSILNLYRQIDVNMLDKKFRGYYTNREKKK